MESEAVGDTAIVVKEVNQENGADTQFQAQVQSDVVNILEAVSDTDGTQFKDGSKSFVAEVNQEDTSESDNEAPCGMFGKQPRYP